jgi:plasmid rolling circle replication initiator protein Rep
MKTHPYREKKFYNKNDIKLIEISSFKYIEELGVKDCQAVEMILQERICILSAKRSRLAGIGNQDGNFKGM